MGVGYMLLYAAFVVVALWLVAELLLQNKAPLVWRALALAGFLGVVAGMQLGSVAVIGLGAAAFAVGQTFVTLSVKRGYDAGWSLRRPDGSLPGPLARVPLLGGEGEPDEELPEPVGEVGPVEGWEEAYADEPADGPHTPPPAADPQQVYEMQPLHEDDSDGYGVYTGATATQQGYHDASGYGGYQQQDPYAAAYQGGWDQTQYGAAAYQGYQDASGYGGYQQQDPYAAAYQGGWDQTQYTQNWDPAQQQTGYTDWSQQQHQAYGDYAAQQQHQQQHPDTWQPSA
ncbi:hypothetical protein [Peterkaempfera griseoplana]|uniref:hypothetical protein n=1 Tax=Peterkaempfera griseoplana TaxID=66896 RepID=UPI0006E399F1|nr:hypothetical protein [Peterkaempfera griseoplana]